MNKLINFDIKTILELMIHACRSYIASIGVLTGLIFIPIYLVISYNRKGANQYNIYFLVGTILSSCIDVYFGISKKIFLLNEPFLGQSTLRYFDHHYPSVILIFVPLILWLESFNSHTSLEELNKENSNYETLEAQGNNHLGTEEINHYLTPTPVMDNPIASPIPIFKKEPKIEKKSSYLEHKDYEFLVKKIIKDQKPDYSTLIIKHPNYRRGDAKPQKDLLNSYKEEIHISDADIQSISETINSVFEDFMVPAHVGKCIVSYSVVIFAVSLTKRIKLTIINKLEPELSSALGVNVHVKVNSELGLPVCIEVPNHIRPILSLKKLMNSDGATDNSRPLSFILGLGLSGSIYRVQLEDLPHLLIAGTTGSGKSVCLHTIIIGLIFTTPISNLQFIMIDPKIIELSMYKSLPHLLMRVIHEHSEALLALEWLIEEMDRRYLQMSEIGVRNIKEFNSHATQQSRLNLMKNIVLIVDEFGDLTLDRDLNFNLKIIKLSQKARAAGIYIILSTQRPTIDIVTGALKANIPGRIALQVSSKLESRIIIDESGAEILRGKGDLLFYRPGMHTVRLQGPYITPDEIRRIVNFWS